MEMLLRPLCHVVVLRRLLPVLLAIGLVLRMGAGCEAMAATPAKLMATQSHCVEIPAKPGKPIKSDVAACALCVMLPDAADAKIGVAPIGRMGLVTDHTDRLAGMSGGPAPPPPKMAPDK